MINSRLLSFGLRSKSVINVPGWHWFVGCVSELRWVSARILFQYDFVISQYFSMFRWCTALHLEDSLFTHISEIAHDWCHLFRGWGWLADHLFMNWGLFLLPDTWLLFRNVPHHVSEFVNKLIIYWLELRLHRRHCLLLDNFDLPYFFSLSLWRSNLNVIYVLHFRRSVGLSLSLGPAL